MVANRSGASGPDNGSPWCLLVVVRRIAWLAFIGAATPLDTTPSVWKVNRPQHFGLTLLEFPGRDPALWDALGTRLEPTTPGPSGRVHHPIVAPLSRRRNTDSATHNEPPEPPQRPHSSSPFHPQVPHFWRLRTTLAATPGIASGRRCRCRLRSPATARSQGGARLPRPAAEHRPEPTPRKESRHPQRIARDRKLAAPSAEGHRVSARWIPPTAGRRGAAGRRATHRRRYAGPRGATTTRARHRRTGDGPSKGA